MELTTTGANSDGIVASLAALAQGTRLAIFRLLLEHAPRGLTPGAIAARLTLAPATLSFHLKELASAGLILDRRESRFIWYQANVPAMNGLVAYLTENCCRATSGRDDPACAAGVCVPSKARRRNCK
jgi:ArsR family transcriptional regulator, arsenate/arsenite/antimonite-responsive transcriptional repressor